MAEINNGPNRLLEFRHILGWIAKRNNYCIHSEGTELSKGFLKLEIELHNEPVSFKVTVKVTVLASQHQEYYERVLRTVLDICELDFNDVLTGPILSEMVKGTNDSYLNLRAGCDGIEVVLGEGFGFSK